MKIVFLLSVFLLTGISEGFSQKIKQLSVAATTEAIGLPFTNYFPIHPGLEVKATLRQVEKSKSIRSFNVGAGFFHHRRLETAIYLGGEYQHSFKLLHEKVSLDLPIGLGYLHSFYPSPLYEQNEDGNFDTVFQLGRPHAYLNLGIGVSCLGSGKVQPFIRQEMLLEAPFANGIPLITHSMLKAGIHLKISKS
ncbi:MAG: hypothetical protein AAF740_01305 [Bacteroidota bacterium]